MKKLFIFAISICLFLISCATPITNIPEVEKYQCAAPTATEPQIEFIGFKADRSLLSTSSKTKNYKINGKYPTVLSPYEQWKSISTTPTLRNIGSTLSNNNLAVDKSYSYFESFSLNDLELYKTPKRFISFIEVEQNQYNYEEKNTKQTLWGVLGSLSLVCGLSMHAMPLEPSKNDIQESKGSMHALGAIYDVAGLFSIYKALKSPKTYLNFSGIYNIYIYDTIEKRLLRKESVYVQSTDTFKGLFNHADTNISNLNNYYAQKISNSILEKYDELNKWLSTLPPPVIPEAEPQVEEAIEKIDELTE